MPVRDIIGKNEAETSLHLFQHGNFADLTLSCQGRTFNVHKFILLTKGGTFFQSVVCGGFAESHTSSIDLPEDDPHIIELVLLHIYTGQYESGVKTTESPAQSPHDHGPGDGKHAPDDRAVVTSRDPMDTDAVMTHVAVFAAAVKFGIQSLQDQARIAFVRTFP
jgi:hypothetical protein